MSEFSGKSDGFKDERYIIIPTESFADYAGHPLVRILYPTDVGFFPKARAHYREREEGADQYILIYCVDGKGIIEVDGKTYSIKKAEAFCIPRGKRHKYYADNQDPWSILWVHFKGENTKYFPLDECRTVQINSKYSENRMAVFFNLIFRVLERNYTMGNFIYLSQVLSLLLAEVYYREKVDESSVQDKHVTMVIRFMYKNLTKQLTLEEISREVDLSKSYLNSIFKEQTGRSPVDFFLHLKMQEACKLLQSTDMYIYEVSTKMGYTDPYYFSRIFKKVVGVSPKEYKKGDYLYFDP
ncbi:helix-turn-helix domain-containing protein [Muricomes intestini]|jgi:AraC-like DNA-binding protein|uniref:helix-turn-helix domain-containing protein n=1 Tax=Muricomes intestini TaxID=1796634 RepID=UPI000E7F8E0F|nr:AraC family transcriptional regulator [Lachnospiraceae bacterium]HCR84454.1 AraC family transcriptional regulator [Lachnospiraceae bacterium]